MSAKKSFVATVSVIVLGLIWPTCIFANKLHNMQKGMNIDSNKHLRQYMQGGPKGQRRLEKFQAQEERIEKKRRDIVLDATKQKIHLEQLKGQINKKRMYKVDDMLEALEEGDMTPYEVFRRAVVYIQDADVGVDTSGYSKAGRLLVILHESDPAEEYVQADVEKYLAYCVMKLAKTRGEYEYALNLALSAYKDRPRDKAIEKMIEQINVMIRSVAK